MKPSECGVHNPPADGTREREIFDRFADFLAAAGPPLRSGDKGRPRSAAERYRMRFLVWRLEAPIT